MVRKSGQKTLKEYELIIWNEKIKMKKGKIYSQTMMNDTYIPSVIHT